MANFLEKAISILAGNLNSGRSYLFTAIAFRFHLRLVEVGISVRNLGI